MTEARTEPNLSAETGPMVHPHEGGRHVFTLPNGQRIRFETSFGNLFNRTLFGERASNWSAANFGQVFSQANSPRSIQMALRYDF